MSRRFRNLQLRFGDARPGLELAAVERAALPVSVLRVDVLAQEPRPIPLTQAYVLKFLHQGLTSVEEVGAFLGLPSADVVECVADLVSSNMVWRAKGGSLHLTAQGSVAAIAEASIRPTLRQFPVSFDRVTWASADYRERQLITKEDARARDYILLPAAKNARISLEDVRPPDINHNLVRSGVRVLKVRKVVARKYRYLPVELLIYVDPVTLEVQLAVCVDDRLMSDHSVTLDGLGAAQRVGIAYETAPAQIFLGSEIETLRESAPRVIADARGIPKRLLSHAPDGGSIEDVRGFEHADILAEALEFSQRRLIIASPHVSTAVVDSEFLVSVTECLTRGVQVTLVTGAAADASESESAAFAMLSALAKRNRLLSLHQLDECPRPILISDDSTVESRFDWLSYRGASRSVRRIDSGTVIRNAAVAEARSAEVASWLPSESS